MFLSQLCQITEVVLYIYFSTFYMIQQLLITLFTKSRKVTLGVALDRTALALISVPSSKTTPSAHLPAFTMILATD